ncbi:hypothetical protein HZS55_15685 [Halosimplex rubrum]|uniref:KOW domain-containing protein n=1 Tax=Halosimplex rubrum TaxID=869889 RepID=A0A7D5P447_9EURY|nr:hypothetical protein [Halosimplex rubrum]QLH78641.1 hypothetical protein HZS55_15685 [Halosimplex rubrum]
MASEEFPFEQGDDVLVRAREHGTHGTIVAKFTAECKAITERPGPRSAIARFDLPFGTMNSVTISPFEGEFEVVDDVE